MNENEKICPLMSTAGKIVNCTRDCAWFDKDIVREKRCAIFTLVDAVEYVGEMCNIYQPCEDEE